MKRKMTVQTAGTLALLAALAMGAKAQTQKAEAKFEASETAAEGERITEVVMENGFAAIATLEDKAVSVKQLLAAWEADSCPKERNYIAVPEKVFDYDPAEGKLKQRDTSDSKLQVKVSWKKDPNHGECIKQLKVKIVKKLGAASDQALIDEIRLLEVYLAKSQSLIVNQRMRTMLLLRKNGSAHAAKLIVDGLGDAAVDESSDEPEAK